MDVSVPSHVPEKYRRLRPRSRPLNLTVMLFHSFDFLIFFPVVVIVYFLLPHRYRWFHLLAASCYFYASFVPVYLLVVAAATGSSYLCAFATEAAQGARRTRWLYAGIGSNLLLLCFFKYHYFFAGGFNDLIGLVGVQSLSVPLSLLFPLGLSFQVFQLVGYLFAVNAKTVKAERHFGIFALFVLFFPKLAAGPIERPQDLLPQFREPQEVNRQRIVGGLKLMLWGYFKKLVIADRLALYVNDVYEAPELWNTAAVWLATLVCFPLQLYCDFSGYSNIAVGCALVMGFRLVENFRRPFLAPTTAEFWNRWHISLSTWLRDYVYMPVVLALRNHGKAAVVAALLVTFLVSGFWHGAGWHFIVYGLLQGVIIAAEFLLGIKAFRLEKVAFKRWTGRIVTVSLWALTLIFFRSADLGQATVMVKKVLWDFDFSLRFPTDVPKTTYLISALSVAFMFAFENGRLERWVAGRCSVRREVVLASSLAIALIALGVYHNLSFIYFRF